MSHSQRHGRVGVRKQALRQPGGIVGLADRCASAPDSLGERRRTFRAEQRAVERLAELRRQRIGDRPERRDGRSMTIIILAHALRNSPGAFPSVVSCSSMCCAARNAWRQGGRAYVAGYDSRNQ
ncbi:MAG: hypothetical protein NZ699_04240 [Roseiflexus sp.]|nr:hypothetical protein [Roseiflexus sp.]MDW8148937.1 hypothetical protein [Roseiflexaceae bacterium]